GQPAGPASDVYALGVVAYECLAGHRPFQGDSAIDVALAHAQDAPPPLPTTVPPPLRDLVFACLAKSAADRPTDAQVAARAEALRGRSGDHAVAGLATAPIAVTPPRATVPPPTERTQAMAVPAPLPARAAAPAAVPPPGPADPPRSRRGAAVAAALVGLLVVGGGAVALGNTLLGGGGGDEGAADPAPVSTPRTTPSPTAETTDEPAPSPTVEETEEAPSPTPTPEDTDEPAPTPSPTPEDTDGPIPTPSPTPSETDSDSGELVVDGDALVGRNGTQVMQELLGQGLSFRRLRVSLPSGADASPCTVQRVTPTGEVEPGTTISVYVWYEPGGDCGPVPGSGAGRAVPQLLLPAGGQ
ncbi:protein kinase, partial [Motilibacter deserti]